MGPEVVECWSGWTYAERPHAIILEHTRRVVEAVLAEWQSPQGKHFRVRCIGGEQYELVYRTAEDLWEVRAL